MSTTKLHLRRNPGSIVTGTFIELPGTPRYEYCILDNGCIEAAWIVKQSGDAGCIAHPSTPALHDALLAFRRNWDIDAAQIELPL